MDLGYCQIESAISANAGLRISPDVTMRIIETGDGIRDCQNSKILPRTELVETPEIEIPTSPVWLGGALEAGFSVRMARRTNESFSPRITFTDSDRDNRTALINSLQKLQESVKCKENRATIAVYGEDAVKLAQMAKPYSPSRSQVIELFELWQFDEQKHQKLNQFLTNNYYRQAVPEETYEELLEDSYFLAGVLDTQAKYSLIKSRSDPGNFQKRLTITSRNKPLIAALCRKFDISSKSECRITGKKVTSTLEELSPYLKVLKT
jgi:hypothetical protein